MPEKDLLILNKYRWGHKKAGGSETHIYELLSRLPNEYNITFLCGKHSGEDPSEVGWGDIIQPTSDNLPGMLGLLKIYLICTIHAYYYILRSSPDVVITVDTPLPWLIITKERRISIFHHLALDSFFQTHYFPFDWLGYIAEKLGVYINKQNEVIAVSKSTFQTLASNGIQEENLTIIKNGINITKYECSPGRANPIILFLGGLETYKGADRLPQIHQQLQDQCSRQVRLDIAGRSGEITSEIEEYCNKCPSAFYHGFVSESQKINLLQEAWALVIPSRVEGYGIVVIEANACGTPAVGTNVRGLRDSIEDGKTGLLVEEKIEKIAEGLAKIIQDDELRLELSDNARKYAATHSWDSSAETFESLLDQ